MASFGHIASNRGGFFVDQWGVGPYVLITSAGRFVFEDSSRFGPCLLDGKTLEPTNEIIPEDSPFWPAWTKWRDEGRITQDGKTIGKGEYKAEAMYCVYTRRTRKSSSSTRGAKPL
jgi:hypothetical protein